MGYIDSIGQWETAGVLNVTTEWQQFPISVTGDPQTNKELFKLSYVCDWPNRQQRYASYGLIRFEFSNGSVVGTFRIWPSPESKMRGFPIPEEVLDVADIEYFASVRKVNRSRYNLPDLDPPWSLTLDYFAGHTAPP